MVKKTKNKNHDNQHRKPSIHPSPPFLEKKQSQKKNEGGEKHKNATKED